MAGHRRSDPGRTSTDRRPSRVYSGPVYGEGFFHLEIKVHSRRAGSSVMAGIAYRTAERLPAHRDEDLDPTGDRAAGHAFDPAAAHAAYQTGTVVDIHDYSRKRGVTDWYTLIPAGAPDWMTWPEHLGDVWAAVAAREDRSTRRATATEAREAVLGLPAELGPETRADLARDFAQTLVSRYGVVATVALHEPGRDGDRRNHHAHIMISDRRCGRLGFGEKARELHYASGGRDETRYLRAVWASMLNEGYERDGVDLRVDHRSYRDREADARARGDSIEAEWWAREATVYMGRTLTQTERTADRRGPVTELGRKNRDRRDASLERERVYQEKAIGRDPDRDRDSDRGREIPLPGEPDWW